MDQLQLPISENTRFEIASHYTNDVRFLVDVQTAFNASDQILQQKRNTIKVINLLDQQLAVKAFRVPSAIQGIIYHFFRESKAKRSFCYAKKLLDKGINTHKPIAYAEMCSTFRLRESFFVSSLIEHDFTIRDELNKAENANKETIVQFTRFTYKMHRANILHLDHTPGNTLIKKTPQGFEFSVIDINRMKFKSVSLAEGLHNLSRLTHCPTILQTMAETYAQCANADSKECLRLLTHYCKKFRQRLERKKRFKQFIGRKT